MFGFNKSTKAECPLYQKPCKEHGCLWYVRLSGKTADGRDNEEYSCAIVMNVRLTLEAAQQSHQAGASADKVANEVNSFHKSTAEMNGYRLMEDEKGNRRLVAHRDIPQLTQRST